MNQEVLCYYENYEKEIEKLKKDIEKLKDSTRDIKFSNGNGAH